MFFSYAEAFEAGPTLAGGKGWNLGRLDRYGFPVPRGGVISAEIYRELIGRPEIVPLVRGLADIPADGALRADVVERLDALRAAIGRSPLPLAVLSGLEGFLERLGLNECPLAVRSSATAEDGRSASFAGVHESVLGVSGLDAVRDAMKACFASLWTPRALAYRRRMGIGDEGCTCAIVVCAMVRKPRGDAPHAAGVAFTCDPRTGRRDLLVIEAVAGPGLAGAQGTAQPSQFTVRPELMRRRIVDRSGPQPSPPVLDDAQVEELASLALRVHWALGDGQDPQDLEWAHDGERPWLVQARPATALPRPGFAAVADRPVTWSNGNIKDVLPGVPTTMAWGIVQPAVQQTLYTVQGVVGYAIPPGMEPLRRFSGRGYFDLTSLQWAFYDSLGASPADFNRDMGGAQPEIPVPTGPPLRGREGRRRIRARLRLLRRLLGFDREMRLKTREIQEMGQAFRSRLLEGIAREDLFRELARWRSLAAGFNPLFQLANANCGLWLTLSRALLRGIDPARGEALASRLLVGGGDVTSAEHGYRVFDLAEVARHDPDALAFLRDSQEGPSRDDPGAWASLPEGSPFRKALSRYLQEFGHRGVFESEVANPRWIEDPRYILETVRGILDAAPGTARDPRESAAIARRSAEAELGRIGRLRRPFVRWAIARARRALALRESARSAMMAALEPIRRILQEIGCRLRDEGQFGAPEDVFHLAPIDVEAYLTGDWDGRGASALAADRRARREAWLAESPPNIITWPESSQPSPATVLAEERPVDGAIDRWRGVAASPGVASGPARVIHDPREGHRLRQGDVLVAPSTDPGWTPLFLRASAVVMETGGYLSHGAIVAREYGLPTVVNLPGILRQFADGETLEVDGDRGEVRRGPAVGPPTEGPIRGTDPR